jgi:hypothetical protein
LIVAMQIDRDAERTLGGRHTRHVVDMRVRKQDMAYRELLAPGERQKARHLIARIDDHGVARPLAPDDETILEERTDGLALHYHGTP